MPAVSLPEKRCLSCGRWFSWRKKWKSCWDDVAYCSDACRGVRLTAEERLLTRTLFEVLAERAAPQPLCPSEVARRASPEEWRPHLPSLRVIAGRLASFGSVAVVHNGRHSDCDFHIVDEPRRRARR